MEKLALSVIPVLLRAPAPSAPPGRPQLLLHLYLPGETCFGLAVLLHRRLLRVGWAPQFKKGSCWSQWKASVDVEDDWLTKEDSASAPCAQASKHVACPMRLQLWPARRMRGRPIVPHEISSGSG